MDTQNDVPTDNILSKTFHQVIIVYKNMIYLCFAMIEKVREKKKRVTIKPIHF